ncbi:MAG: energy transducer TonB [Campylobacteraceae bacterium]|jgi:protein TonB|nr:energy transducer TonB [Campylobacteraceae bacterium]
MKTPNIFTSFVLSLMLHAGFASCLIGFYNHKEIKKTEHLIVQIEGEISKNQLEEKRAQETPPPPPPKTKPKPQPKQQESIGEPKKIEEEQPQEPDTANNDINQTAQRIDEKIDDTKEITKYLAVMKKRLSSNIKYPLKAKRKGYVGVPVIGFSILEDGSAADIHIVKSSGYELLDKSAFEAVKNSSPFEKPPRPLLDISVDIFFRKE